MPRKLIIGQSGGPTPVINCSLSGAIASAQRRGWRIYGMMNGLEGLLYADEAELIVDLTDVDAMTFLGNGPGAALGTTRISPQDAELRKMASCLNRRDIDAVVYIGGNDSAEMLQGLSLFTDIQLVHAIKTVDNDLPETHHCPGFGSAALFNAVSFKNLWKDYSSYRVVASGRSQGASACRYATAPVIVYQVMGRRTGWLTQAMAFAKVDPRGELDPERPPHVFLSWETPFVKDDFLAHVQNAVDRFGRAAVVVGEDVQLAGDGRQSLVEVESERANREVRYDSHHNAIHGGSDSFSSAGYLASLISDELKVDSVSGEVKLGAIVPQHLQRSAAVSPVDAAEAFRVGWAAVDAIAEAHSGQSVVLKRQGMKTTTELTSVSNIAHKVRCVEDRYLMGLDGPSQEFVDEFIDLIGGPMALPHHTAPQLSFVQLPLARVVHSML